MGIDVDETGSGNGSSAVARGKRVKRGKRGRPELAEQIAEHPFWGE
jgi:hypothetical protein